MTKKQDTTEGEARKLAEEIERGALRAFSQAIFSAPAKYEQERAKLAGKGKYAQVKVTDVLYGKDYRQAKSIATLLGNVFLHGSITEDDRRTLGRLYSALRPPIDDRNNGQAIEIAESIVRKYAEAYQRSFSGLQHTDVPAPFTVPAYEKILAIALVTHVSPGFRGLRKQYPAVKALLDRYSAGKGRKAKKGEPTKLAAAGILCKLNQMCGKHRGVNNVKGSVRHGAAVVTDTPLGDRVTPKRVADAIRDFRK